MRASDSDGTREFEAPEDLTYVLQVMWNGEHTLLLTVVGDDEPRLVIAPK